MNKVKSAPVGRLMWVDVLRVMACFMVVLSHGCDAFVGQFDTDRSAFLWGAGIGSLMRPCVPLFVMMTAVLILPLRSDTGLRTFYRKRVGRLLWPLVFWSLALPAASYFYFSSPLGAVSATPLVEVTDYTPAQLGNRLWSWVLNFNFDTTPLWYLYMLVGLYLILPLVDGWISNASRSDMRTFLTLWGITLVLPLLRLVAPMLGYEGNYGNFGLLGECDWNPFGTFYYLSGFLGYVVLTRYLIRFPLQWSGRRLASVFVPMFILGYAITFGGFVLIQEYHPGDYAFLEILWFFCGINVLMMTLPVFVGMQRIKGNARPWLTRLADLTFGIYLCHFFFEFVGYDLFALGSLPAVVRILGGCLFSFLAAAALTWLLKQNRLTSRLVS